MPALAALTVGEREGGKEGRALVGCALQPEPAAVRFDKGFRNVEAKSDAGVRPRGCVRAALDRPEEALLVFRRDAGAVVGHLDAQPARVVRIGAQINAHG